jgi:hypothetical protein
VVVEGSDLQGVLGLVKEIKGEMGGEFVGLSGADRLNGTEMGFHGSTMVGCLEASH